MRPVGAPDDAVGIRSNQGAGQRDANPGKAFIVMPS
jgi:hypothetical protein